MPCDPEADWRTLGGRTLPIEADRDRLIQIFSNLFGNAIKFSAEGTRIYLAGQRCGDFVEFEVSDAGIGISEDELLHVFDGHWQAAPTTEGAGLGLAIVKALVDAHGGTIAIESVVGRGTTIRFTIPIARPL